MQNDDFTAEWLEKDGKILDVRITKGVARFHIPWYRKIMSKLRNNWQHIIIQCKS